MPVALINSKQLLAVLDKKRAGRPLVKVAPELGVSYQFLSKVVAGDYAPGPTLAKALGYEQVFAYRRLPRKTNGKANGKAKPSKKTKPQTASEIAAAFLRDQGINAKAAKPKKQRQSTGMKATEFEPSKMA